MAALQPGRVLLHPANADLRDHSTIIAASRITERGAEDYARVHSGGGAPFLRFALAADIMTGIKRDLDVPELRIGAEVDAWHYRLGLFAKELASGVAEPFLRALMGGDVDV